MCGCFLEFTLLPLPGLFSEECLNCVKPVVPVTTMSGAEFRFSKGGLGGGNLFFFKFEVGGVDDKKGDDCNLVMVWAACKNFQVTQDPLLG